MLKTPTPVFRDFCKTKTTEELRDMKQIYATIPYGSVISEYDGNRLVRIINEELKSREEVR